MINRVYTYSTISEIRNAPYYSEIAPLAQVTISRETARSMSSAMPVFRRNTVSFFELKQRLFPDWNTAEQRFAFSAVCNRVIRSRMEETEDQGIRDWLSGCRKNLHMAVSNIIRLEEAGIRPEDLSDCAGFSDGERQNSAGFGGGEQKNSTGFLGREQQNSAGFSGRERQNGAGFDAGKQQNCEGFGNRDMLLFCKLWKILETEDDRIAAFRNRRRELADSHFFTEEVNRIWRFHGQKVIVWNGFPYFTPIQQFVLDCFRSAGYETVALIPADPNYPYANEIWSRTYRPENGFAGEKDWARPEKGPSETDSRGLRKNPLGEIFETGSYSSAKNVKLIKYSNTMAFVKDVPRILDEGFRIYSTDDYGANSILREFYPEKYGKRNLLSYPVGQFVFALHAMWNEERQTVVITEDALRLCFASGWISVSGQNSLHYTGDLERVLPFFEGCRKISDWENRADALRDIYENAVSVFDDENGNPLRVFDMFSLPEERLHTLLSMIGRVTEIAGKLFPGRNPVSVREHLRRLDLLLEMPDGMPADLCRREKDVVRKIFKVLESERIRDFRCYPGDMAQTMLSFMNGSLDEEEEEQESGQLQTIVFHLFQIESASVSAKGRVHICLADISRLPGDGNTFLWPLNEDILLQLQKRLPDSYAKNWLQSGQLQATANRYYLFSALNNENVELSWIQNQGEKQYAPSPYLTLLKKLTDARLWEDVGKRISRRSVSEIPEQARLSAVEAGDGWEQTLQKKIAYRICPMRYLYSYVLQERPAYHNEYQKNRAIVRLIQILYELLRHSYSMEEIAEQVLALFPNIRPAEKRQILDDAKQGRLPVKELYTEGADGTSAWTENFSARTDLLRELRMQLLFPDSGQYLRLQSPKPDSSDSSGGAGKLFVPFDEDGFRNCMFCPHERYCTGSRFGVDKAADR